MSRPRLQPTMGWTALTSQARRSYRPLSKMSEHAEAAAPSSDPSAFPELGKKSRAPGPNMPSACASTAGLPATTLSVPPAMCSRPAAPSEQSPWAEAVLGETRPDPSLAERQCLVDRLSQVHPWADRSLLQVISFRYYPKQARICSSHCSRETCRDCCHPRGLAGCEVCVCSGG